MPVLCWFTWINEDQFHPGQIEESTGRIAALVQSVKSYSYMDQAPLQEVDVHQGLESTLAMLHHKLKDISIERDFDPDLPRLYAYGGELNQVWTNLLDNAADAVADVEKPRILLRTACEKDNVVVEIADNGPGIPPELQGRIFEPFFTTKGIGRGTGLGLGISHRVIVGRHKGDLHLESKPGDTRFQARLPLPRLPLHSNGASK